MSTTYTREEHAEQQRLIRQIRSKHQQKPHRLKKDEALRHWQALEPVNPAERMDPIPYKHDGSTFAECGIRINGSRAFVDAVLSQLQGLLALENSQTRLSVNYTQATVRETREPLPDSYAVYVQCHERGPAARFYNALFSE